MKNADKPAMPVEIQASSDGVVMGIQTSEFTGFEIGLTKREYFAALAMQGLLYDKSIPHSNYLDGVASVAERAVKVADELLKQLEQ